MQAPALLPSLDPGLTSCPGSQDYPPPVSRASPSARSVYLTPCCDPLVYPRQMKQAYWDLTDLAVLGMVIWIWFQIP